MAAATAMRVVRWYGVMPEAAGRSVETRFALYQNQAGGLALWSETQLVKVGADGRFTVLLGAASADGLPQAIFQGEDARWVEVRRAMSGGESGGGSSSLSFDFRIVAKRRGYEEQRLVDATESFNAATTAADVHRTHVRPTSLLARNKLHASGRTAIVVRTPSPARRMLSDHRPR
jgi:hypothetical protein